MRKKTKLSKIVEQFHQALKFDELQAIEVLQRADHVPFYFWEYGAEHCDLLLLKFLKKHSIDNLSGNSWAAFQGMKKADPENGNYWKTLLFLFSTGKRSDLENLWAVCINSPYDNEKHYHKILSEVKNKSYWADLLIKHSWCNDYARTEYCVPHASPEGVKKAFLGTDSKDINFLEKILLQIDLSKYYSDIIHTICERKIQQKDKIQLLNHLKPYLHLTSNINNIIGHLFWHKHYQVIELFSPYYKDYDLKLMEKAAKTGSSKWIKYLRTKRIPNLEDLSWVDTILQEAIDKNHLSIVRYLWPYRNMDYDIDCVRKFINNRQYDFIKKLTPHFDDKQIKNIHGINKDNEQEYVALLNKEYLQGQTVLTHSKSHLQIVSRRL